MRTLSSWCFAAATLVAADRRAGMRGDWCPRWGWRARLRVLGLLYGLADELAYGRRSRRLAAWLSRPFVEPALAVLIVGLGAVAWELLR